jgi:predicted dehydrogenase
MSIPVRVGVLGLGQRGLQHLKNLWKLQSHGHAEIVALSDAFEDNLAEAKLQQYVPGFQAGSILHTTDFNEFLATQPDAVYICIPPNLHAGQVLQAALAGCHLFVEKPMSLYLNEAIEMEEVILESGVLAAVGFQLRYDNRNEAINEFLMGKRAVMATYTRHAPLEAHSVKHMKTELAGGPANRIWTASRAWSGGTMVEAGIHLLDLWRYWFGDVEWVQAAYVLRPSEEIIDGADNPYAYSATFGFKNGAIGSMNLSRLRRVFHTEGTHQLFWNEGHLMVEGDEVVAYHYDGPYPPTAQPDISQIRKVIPTPPANNSTYEISRSFVQAVAQNDHSLIRSSFSDAMNSLAAVLGANISDELGGARINLQELLTDERFSSIRARPAQTV